MAAKSALDVFLAGIAVMAGVIWTVLAVQQGKELAMWRRTLGQLVASLGFICYGIGRVTIGPRDLFWFVIIGSAGIMIAIFGDQGVKASDLFPTLLRRRRSGGPGA